jgi:hypothetical protein
MTDKFEKAVQDILKESAGNGGPTNEHILTALIATNDDLDTQHAETKAWHTEVTTLITEHVKEADIRDRRLDALEASGSRCPGYVNELVEKRAIEERQFHREFHDKHVLECHAPHRSEDPDGSDFRERRNNPALVVESIDRRVWVMWGIGLFIAATIAADLIGLAIKALTAGS